jgi:pyruvate,water dikinase
VALSADPRTGRGCVVLEAAAGRGDRVVDGRVVPDRFVVDERGVIEDARPAQPGAPVLPEPVVTALAALVRECARRAAAPRDVEWAWDGARLALLQSRPITTLAGRHVYSNRLMREWTPGLVAPLVWSTNSLGMTRTVFRRVFTSLIGDDGFDYGTLVRRIHSRLYADLTVLGARLERAGFPPNAFEWMVRGEHARFRPPRPTPRLARAALRFAAFAWRHARLEREVEAFVTEHDAATAAWTGADWAAATPAALGVATRDALALHGRTQWCAWISALNLHLRARILGRMIARHAPDVDVKDLLGGLRERAGASPERELERIAHAAAPLDAGTLAAMLAGDDAAVRVRLDATPAGRMLAREVGELLARHGHLSANATDFTRPTWAERPGQVWAALGRHVAHPAPAAGTAPRARDAAVARIHARFGPVKRRVFDGLLRSTSRWAGLRERTSLLMSRDAATLRRLFLEHGRRLAAAGALDGPEDVFMLELEELEHANHGRRAPEATRALARLHRREMEEDARFEPEDTLAGEPVARAAAAAPEHHDYLVGIAASPGVRHLTARVVRDPAELPAVLTVDDALVAPFTDGGWTPLFAEVGAVVSESGGQLSHAAILAREYGLPAVVAVRGALAHIRDGQRIVVDGGAGRVYLHDGEDTGRRS